MIAELWLRALGASLCLPVGGLAVRLLIGLSAGLAAHSAGLLTPSGADLSAPAALLTDLPRGLGALALGALAGLLLSLPLRLSASLKGTQLPESAATLGHYLALSLFMALGGPLFLAQLLQPQAAEWALNAESLRASIDLLGHLFSAAFVLLLPSSLAQLCVGLLLSLAARLGPEAPALAPQRALTLLATLLLWIALLPLMLDWLRDALWLWPCAWIELCDG